MNIFQKTMKYVALFIAVMALNAYNDTKMTFNVDKADSVVHKEIFGVLMERLGNQWDGNGAIWVGTNSTTANTDGMRQSVINHIRHFSASPNGQAIDIYGPRGQLGFEDHKATLESVRIVTPREGVLTGGTAHYEGKAERVLIDGPLFFTSPGLNVIAQSGEMHLDDSSVDVAGPVNGRFESPAKPVTAAAKP